jgi:hypothetical protein
MQQIDLEINFSVMGSFLILSRTKCLMQHIDLEITVMSQPCDDSIVGVMYKAIRLAAMRG